MRCRIVSLNTAPGKGLPESHRHRILSTAMRIKFSSRGCDEPTSTLFRQLMAPGLVEFCCSRGFKSSKELEWNLKDAMSSAQNEVHYFSGAYTREFGSSLQKAVRELYFSLVSELAFVIASLKIEDLEGRFRALEVGAMRSILLETISFLETAVRYDIGRHLEKEILRIAAKLAGLRRLLAKHAPHIKGLMDDILMAADIEAINAVCPPRQASTISITRDA